MTGTRSVSKRAPKRVAAKRAARRGRPRKIAEVLPPALESLAQDMERDGQRLIDAAKALRDSVKK